MQVIRTTEVPETDNTHREIFVGSKVAMRSLVEDDLSETYRFNIVTFAQDSRTKFHTHTCDQILYATEGTGMVGTRDGDVEISAGDTAFIPAGEEHRHGANEKGPFSHISLQTATCQTEVIE